MRIGGNIRAILQVKDTATKNVLGESVSTWVDCTAVTGWLDLSSGDSRHTTFNAKVQESTHIFLCDFMSLESLTTGWLWNPFSFVNGIIHTTDNATVDITSENARFVINNQVYEILLIDNPMEMNQHMEIYLKHIGGEQNVY